MIKFEYNLSHIIWDKHNTHTHNDNNNHHNNMLLEVTLTNTNTISSNSTIASSTAIYNLTVQGTTANSGNNYNCSTILISTYTIKQHKQPFISLQHNVLYYDYNGNLHTNFATIQMNFDYIKST